MGKVSPISQVVLSTVVICFGFLPRVIAQPIGDIEIRTINVHDGLPSSNVYMVMQDSLGFYWISTDKGLVKYDGYQCKKYGMRQGLPHNDIWYTHQDQFGRLWILTFGLDLHYLQNDSISFLKTKTPNFSTASGYGALVVDKYDNLCISYANTVHVLQEDTFKSFYLHILTGKVGTLTPKLFQNKERSAFLLTTVPLTVWEAGKSGKFSELFVYDKNVVSDGLTLEHDSAHSQIPGSETTIIIQSFDTLYTIHNSQLTAYIQGKTIEVGAFPSAERMREKSYRVFVTKDRYVFVGSEDNFVTDKNFNHDPTYDLLSGYKINTVYEDTEGSLWVSTDGNGVLYITREMTSVRHITSNHSDLGVTAIDATDSNVFVGFRGGEILRLNKKSVNTYPIPRATYGQNRFLLKDLVIQGDKLFLLVGDHELRMHDLDSPFRPDLPDETLYFQAQLGLNHPMKKTVAVMFEVGKGLVADKSVKLESIEKINNDNVFTRVISINKGFDNSLMLTQYFGCYRFNFFKDSIVLGRTNPRYKTITSLWAADGTVFSGTPSGLFIDSEDGLDSTFNARLHEEYPITEAPVSVMKLDERGQLWCGTHGSGVYRYSNNGLQVVESLQGTVVSDIFIENERHLWVGTNEGAYELQLDTSGHVNQSKLYTAGNGLSSNEVTSLYVKDNKAYIGTTDGLNVIDLSFWSVNNPNQPVILQSLSSNGKPIDKGNAIDLEPEQNSLDIEFVYISPKSQGNITYHYRLEGLDKEWQETRYTSIRYPLIPAGKYVFQLYAQDANGFRSPNEINFTLQVHEYWWQTIWFKVFGIVLLIGGSFGVYAYRLSSIKKRQTEQAKINRKMAELEMQALQSQMNPHFVFNVLNSIQEFFLSNRIREANDYLSGFSSLLRLFLDSSRDKYIRLDKELELLRLYVELEQRRIPKEIAFSIEMTDEVEPHEMYIPSMLLQPLLENSLNHGILSSPRPGQIVLAIDQTESGVLIISVKDNGIGRDAARRRQLEKNPTHISQAGSIFEDRISVINSSGEGKISVRFEDEVQDDLVVGTNVYLHIDMKINK